MRIFMITKKRPLLLLMVYSLAAIAFVACNSSDDGDTVYNTSAQQDAQGVYNGIYVRVQNGTTDTLTAEGTLTLTATDTLNRVRLTFSSDEMAELAGIAAIPANVSHANAGFTFYNTSTDNTVTGRIGGDKAISAKFSKAIRISARRTVRYNYEFVGSRN